MQFRETIECKGCGVNFTPKKSKMPIRYCTAECLKASRNILRLYGINKAEYDFIWAVQGSQCAICTTTEGTMVVDHCHDTGKIRGVICKPCNTGLGQFRDDTKSLRAAIDYLNNAEYRPADDKIRTGKRTLSNFFAA